MVSRKPTLRPRTHPYKVSLNLNKSEIELIRYTWNTLLVEDEGTTLKRQTRPSSPDFLCECTEDITPRSSEDSFDSQDTITGMARVIKSNSTGIATSLFCRQFYANIIARDREMKNIFPSIEHQSLDLASVLTIVVLQLDDLSSLEDYLMKLGKRHTRILNIEPVHYEILGEVLIQTFHERFGNKFNQELEIVWIKLYLFLANSLLQYGIDPVLNVEKEAVDLKRVPTHMSTSSVRTEKTLVGSPKKGLYQDEKAENSDIDSVTNEVSEASAVKSKHTTRLPTGTVHYHPSVAAVARARARRGYLRK